LKVSNKIVKIIVLSLIIHVIFVMLRVAFYTLLERKSLASIHLRLGPNKPGPLGILVPFADALKLLTKECVHPITRNPIIFLGVPILTLLIPLFLWVIYPSYFPPLLFQFSVLLFLAVASLGVYTILGAGWRRNRRYSFLGAVRAVAQSISYEVRLSLILLHAILFCNYVLLTSKLVPLIVFLFGICILLTVTSLAETNRSPFDFSEGESELVRGFNTEYRSVQFLMIFLAEYISILYMAFMIVSLFMMSGYADLWLFFSFRRLLFIWTRGTLPRLRYDQLISLAWKTFLPVALAALAVSTQL